MANQNCTCRTRIKRGIRKVLLELLNVRAYRCIAATRKYMLKSLTM